MTSRRRSAKRLILIIKFQNYPILIKSLPQGIPIIKLHGCIHDGIGAQVISSPDYLQLFWDDSRQALLKRLETDILQHAIIFAATV